MTAPHQAEGKPPETRAARPPLPPGTWLLVAGSASVLAAPAPLLFDMEWGAALAGAVGVGGMALVLVAAFIMLRAGFGPRRKGQAK